MSQFEYKRSRDQDFNEIINFTLKSPVGIPFVFENSLIFVPRMEEVKEFSAKKIRGTTTITIGGLQVSWNGVKDLIVFQEDNQLKIRAMDNMEYFIHKRNLNLDFGIQLALAREDPDEGFLTYLGNDDHICGEL